MKYKAIVAFNQSATYLVEQHGLELALEKSKTQSTDADIREFEFDTESERMSFLKGVSLTAGNSEPEWGVTNYADINGSEITKGCLVNVPEPDSTDVHKNEFQGTVTGFRGDNALVQDGDGNTFEIETSRLEIKLVFYSLFDYNDKQTLLAGLNSTSLKELKEALLKYIKDEKKVTNVLLKKQEVGEIAVQFELLVQESEEPFEHESAPYFWVDVPKNDGIFEEWENVKTFPTKVQAIKFARENFGANTQGFIKIVTS